MAAAGWCRVVLMADGAGPSEALLGQHPRLSHKHVLLLPLDDPSACQDATSLPSLLAQHGQVTMGRQ